MTLDVAKLALALHGALGVDEFIASESRSQIAIETLGEISSNTVFHQHDLRATVFADRKRGRGSANLVPSRGQDLSRQIQEASTRAHGALGPSWRLPPPAAPARVSVFEPTNHGGIREILQHVRSELERATPASVHTTGATIRVQHSTNRTILSNGFDNQYPSADIFVESIVQTSRGANVLMRVRLRRLSELSVILEAAMERCRERSILDASAGPVLPGLVDVAILHSAYLPENETDYGIWTPLVEQASAAKVRAGMSTHAPGRELLQRPVIGESLSIRSEGTESYALRCAPFSSDGQATRDFAIATDGLATGVSVDHREEALGAGPANGGVRRLLVSGGGESAEALGRPLTRPLLFVRAIDSMRVASRGNLLLDVASSELRSRNSLGVVQTKQIRSAILCGRIQDWLRDAHFSSETEDDSWLAGPRVIRFNNVRIY